MMLDYYLWGIILLPGLILSIYASIKVNSTFNTYNSIDSEKNIPANVLARTILDQAGLTNITIRQIHGHLTDYYNHRKKIIALSTNVYDSSSIAAIGVALHEVGHAIQYKTNYLPIKIRNLIIPICNFANRFLWIFIILGAIFFYTNLGTIFLWVGVGIFGISVLLNLITLPVELNASKRALKLLKDAQILNNEEIHGAKKVLDAAALTYVAGLVVSILNLLRLLIVVLDRKD